MKDSLYHEILTNFFNHIYIYAMIYDAMIYESREIPRFEINNQIGREVSFSSKLKNLKIVQMKLANFL